MPDAIQSEQSSPAPRLSNARFRKLRIAFSATCLIACVLLIALWVRSYSRLQILETRIATLAIQMSSVKGRIAIAILQPSATIGKTYLSVVSGDAADWRKKDALGVAYYHDASITAIIPSHWLLAATCAFLAAVPWIFSIPSRFSLRALLIATTLVAVGLGLMVWLR